MAPRPNSSGMPRHLLLHRVGEERGDGRARAGQDADEEAQHGAARDRPPAPRPVGRAQHDVAETVAGLEDALVGRLLGPRQHLAHAEEPDGHGQEVHAVEHLRDPAGVARVPRDDVDAGHGQHEAEHHADVALDRVLAGEPGHGGEAEQHEGKGLGRAEGERPPGEGGRHQHEEDGPERPRDEGPDGGHAEGGAGPALEGHLVAVDAGDDRGRLAGRVDEHGGDRPAVLRAVVDAGQHDHARGRGHPEGEGQEQRHPRHRPDPGQRADEGAHGHAEQRHEQVERGEGDREAQDQVVEEAHVGASGGVAPARIDHAAQNPSTPVGNGTRSQ